METGEILQMDVEWKVRELDRSDRGIVEMEEHDTFMCR